MLPADTLQIHQVQRGGLPTLTQLIEAGAPRFALSLLALGGVLWLVAYVTAIRTSHREQVTTLPLLAVCLNLTWEIVHSVVYAPPRTIDLYTNLAWLTLDVVILTQVFRFGRRRQTIPQIREYFPAVVVGTLLLCFLGHLTYHTHVTANSIFPDESGAIPAYIINLVMSVLFVGLYYARPDGAGLSKTIGWAKFLGTLCYSVGNILILGKIPNVQYEVQVRQVGAEQWHVAGTVGNTTILPGLVYFLCIGVTIFDVIYVWLLYRGPYSSRRAPTPS